MPRIGIPRARRTALVASALLAGTLLGVPGRPTEAGGGLPGTATGRGGAVATVDATASGTAIEVLRQGGNAVDAAVAAAATLGVTEPYVAALGGGGFFLYYDPRTRDVHTVDGRESAPAAMRADSFTDPSTGRPIPLEEAITSGLSVGVPGTLRQWDLLLRRHGTRPLGDLLRPAIKVAERGFPVDQEFHDQTARNAARFADFVPTRKLFLPGGAPPAVGTTFRNPDLAATYRGIAEKGIGWFYEGGLAREIVRTVRRPPLVEGAARKVRPGLLTASDLASYRAVSRDPVRTRYRGLDVYGMAPPSSGGSTVGEALNILDRLPRPASDPVQTLHSYLEASKLAYADRERYVGDVPGVPLKELLSEDYGRERACLVSPTSALKPPVAAGSPDGQYETCASASGTGGPLAYEGPQTTNLVVSDRWGGVAVYTLTIEQWGGSGITVPGRGFLLNNELTDFSLAPRPGDPNAAAPGKRPRSSIAPTVVLRDGLPFLALGSPGGSTIITTVLQILVHRLDLGMDLPGSVAAPRATQRNTPTTLAERAFLDAYGPALTTRGQILEPYPGPPPEIGAATALEFLGDGLVQAVAEPVRRHGGSARTVRPD
ncbi:gamma-glutamyltranspeptidase/glutathione hydrolase [Actinocorallia herbida]|uniref:Glutathione hydrolase proenzyme n=1 Tax=Actinocorallia herbida TaxID=58109 RepID=A0A3N1DAK6_9ACTN|nr:gamma-glutamyltransferase [Actinocorallia herbida]ROO90563.1 gamma-glutamyltranspeptidase/glutathione hydrolase [Actinocorallia herbida]